MRRHHHFTASWPNIQPPVSWIHHTWSCKPSPAVMSYIINPGLPIGQSGDWGHSRGPESRVRVLETRSDRIRRCHFIHLNGGSLFGLRWRGPQGMPKNKAAACGGTAETEPTFGERNLMSRYGGQHISQISDCFKVSLKYQWNRAPSRQGSWTKRWNDPSCVLAWFMLCTHFLIVLQWECAKHK